jgi:iron complex outermembrane recepter protein
MVIGFGKSALLTGAALSAIVWTPMATAQTVAGAGAADDTSEIIVTANKREQNINDVGTTITALSAATLATRKITSLEDVAAAVPGLAYSPSTTNTPIFTLRGVGFNESSLGVYPAVSVYSDEVPLPFPVMASHAAYDLERIEVLKGPQGTLFGQNSTGGAINYIAAKPTSSFEAGGDIGYGRFNTIEGNAHISGPLSDTIGARLSVTGLNSDDWQRSNSRPTDANGKQSYVAGRLLLDFKPSDGFRIALNINGWRDKSDPQAQQLVAIRPQVPSIATARNLAQLAAAQFSPLSARASDFSTGVGKPRGDRKFFQSALRFDADITDSVTLTALTSYNDYKQTQATDGDGLPLVLFDLIRNDGFIKSFNQEVRLSNDDKSAFRWVLGANFEKSHTFENQDLSYSDSTNNAPAQFNINRSGVTNDQRIHNYAAFGNIEYSLSDALTFKAGARYTSSRNTAAICGYSPGDGNVAAFFNLLGSLNLGGFAPAPTFAPINGTGCYTLNARFVPGDVFRKTLKEDNVSWRAGS